MIELLRENGLRDVKEYPMTFGIATLYLGRKEVRLMLPIVLAMSGASGAIYAVRLLQQLLLADQSVHLIASPRRWW